jgi:hypothetical protein
MRKIEDVVERYEKQVQFWPGTPQTQVEAQARTLLQDAIAYIKHLKPLVGAVTQGESFDDIARLVGRQPSSGD